MMEEKQISGQALKELFRGILKLENVSECRRFFRDLCTLSELQAMAERLQVAKGLYRDEPYRVVSKKVPASTATVTRVAHWLHHGNGGYKLVLTRLQTSRSQKNRGQSTSGQSPTN